jgi:DNA mismatch repair protein MutL
MPSVRQRAPRTLPEGEQARFELRGSDTSRSTPAALPPLRVVGQAGATYIVADGPDGVYLIDQHAAHERVVYERLVQQAGHAPLERQTLLLPVTVDLPPALRTLLPAHLDTLAACGFTATATEDGAVTVTAVPAGLGEGEIGPTLLELGEQLLQAAGTPSGAPRHVALATIACHSAIRAGQTLAMDEMQQVLDQLEQCAQPRTCPHGRPTTLALSHRQLERQFGRKG